MEVQHGKAADPDLVLLYVLYTYTHTECRSIIRCMITVEQKYDTQRNSRSTV